MRLFIAALEGWSNKLGGIQTMTLRLLHVNTNETTKILMLVKQDQNVEK